MEKFTQIKDKPVVPEDEVVFDGEHIDVVKYKDSEIIRNGDKVVFLTYLRDEATFLMRLEYTPAYMYKNRDKSNLRNITNYLTVNTGSMEEGETPEQTIRRELYEENGIILNNMFQFDIEGPYFIDKYNTSQLWFCLLELPVNTYRQIKPPTDGTKNEKLSKTIRVSIGDINQIVKNDLMTKYLVDKLIDRIATNSTLFQ